VNSVVYFELAVIVFTAVVGGSIAYKLLRSRSPRSKTPTATFEVLSRVRLFSDLNSTPAGMEQRYAFRELNEFKSTSYGRF